jgi:hypothetical protein
MRAISRRVAAMFGLKSGAAGRYQFTACRRSMNGFSEEPSISLYGVPDPEDAPKTFVTIFAASARVTCASGRNEPSP